MLSECHFYDGKVILKIFEVADIFDVLIGVIQPLLIVSFDIAHKFRKFLKLQHRSIGFLDLIDPI